MIKLFGITESDEKVRVNIVSYSGNRPGGIEVDEVLEGEGTHYVNPKTKEQWYESESEEEQPKSELDELKGEIAELKSMLSKVIE